MSFSLCEAVTLGDRTRPFASRSTAVSVPASRHSRSSRTEIPDLTTVDRPHPTHTSPCLGETFCVMEISRRKTRPVTQIVAGRHDARTFSDNSAVCAICSGKNLRRAVCVDTLRMRKVESLHNICPEPTPGSTFSRGRSTC